MKIIVERVLKAIQSPYFFFRWMFQNHPWITFIELLAFSAIHAFVILPIFSIFMREDGEFIYFTNLGMIFGLLLAGFSVYGSSLFFDKGQAGTKYKSINNYDVLSLSVRTYLESRGYGLVFAYPMAIGLSLVAAMLAIPVIAIEFLYVFIVKPIFGI